MQPTQEYLAAPESRKTRPEESNGEVKAIIENYSDATHPMGKSAIYLSIDNGVSFNLLGWKVSWLSWWKTLGREWPPHDLYIQSLSSDVLHVRYIEITYDGSEERHASYSFIKKCWHL